MLLVLKYLIKNQDVFEHVTPAILAVCKKHILHANKLYVRAEKVSTRYVYRLYVTSDQYILEATPWSNSCISDEMWNDISEILAPIQRIEKIKKIIE